jgi:thymidylate synthase
MFQVEADCMDDVQSQIIKGLLDRGCRVKPRGQWIYELNGVSFRLNNPRARLIYNHERKYSLILALGELLWYLRGTNSLDIIQYYNRRYSQFSDDGKSLYGAYGQRIFGKKLHNCMNQWEMVVKKLKEDPDSRQAVISIYSAEDVAIKTLDVPCTCYIQYFIRNNKLNCIVNMRSNDIIWGTSYDVFSFTMLQEIMAKELEIDIGWYIHFVGSMHIYDRHLAMAENMLTNVNFEKYIMPDMPDKPNDAIHALFIAEEEIRIKGCSTQKLKESYWDDIRKVCMYNVYKKSKTVQLDDYKIPSYYSALL